MNQYVAALITISLLVMTIPNIYAQSIGDLPEPGATPDSFAYGFKKAFEGLDLAFTFNQNDKVAKHLKFAELRLAEAKAVVENGMPELVDDLARDYENQVADANYIASFADDSPDKESLSESVALASSKHLEILDKVKDTVPEQAKDKISSLKDKTIRGSSEALANLARENPEKSANIVTEMAESRADAARDAAQRGDADDVQEDAGDFEKINEIGAEIMSIAKQIRTGESTVSELITKAQSIHMGILEDVMDKVPEQARTGIQMAMDNSKRATDAAMKGLSQKDNAMSKAEEMKQTDEDHRPESTEPEDRPESTEPEDRPESTEPEDVPEESETQSDSERTDDTNSKSEEMKQAAEDRKP